MKYSERKISRCILPLRNKFEAVEELVQNKVDICLLSETKIDEIFPNQ